MTEKMRTALRSLLEDLRADRDAYRFRIHTIVTKCSVETVRGWLLDVGATESELASIAVTVPR